MPSDVQSEPKMEIGHVLTMDVVAYSTLLINEQTRVMSELTRIVKETECFRRAEAAGQLIRLPTGDGMLLVFFNDAEAPLGCALEIATKLKSEHPEIRLRMGIHSGPVNQVVDVNDRVNVAGAGVDIAQRVMDCGDAGHILLSKRVADDIAPYRRWSQHLHDIGQARVKHGVQLHLYSLHNDAIGNPALPTKLRAARGAKGLVRQLPGRGGLIGGIALVVAVVIAIAFYVSRSPATADIPPKSIAVLPFDNFSDDKENAFFADGIQDDILTSLARIGDLKVISRTSVKAFRNTDQRARNLREIGRTLGVANILEGSVRRDGSRVAVTVQLIDARNDRHLWANRYVGELQDSLGLQGQFAAEIARALHATLSAEEQARVETKPTASAEAYVVYLRANHIERNPDTLLEDYKEAERLYEQAIALDAKFALAHARLASTRAQIFHYYEPTESWKNGARSEAERALQLQPNLADAHIALGQCFYWIDGDYERALAEFARAAELAPNDADVRALIAAIKRRQGRWQEALEAYERAQLSDPQNPNIARNVLFTNTAMRRWPEAARAAERMRAIAPDSLVAKIQSGYVQFQWQGDLGPLRKVLSEIPAATDPDGSVSSTRWDAAMIARDFVEAKRVLDASPLAEFSYTSVGMTPKSYMQGCIALAQGDVGAAQQAFEATRSAYESAATESPDVAERHATLALLYAFMNRNEEAVREGQRAVELKPEAKDALDGSLMNAYLALIYARTGRADDAIALLDHLLNTPGAVDSTNYSITTNDLRYRWEWDPIRNDPRFQKLIDAK